MSKKAAGPTIHFHPRNGHGESAILNFTLAQNRLFGSQNTGCSRPKQIPTLEQRGTAVKILQEVRESYPNDPYLANDLGVYLAASGRLKEGLAQLKFARKRAPLNPVVRLNLGTLYLLLNQFNRAQNEFALLTLYAPDSGVARQNLGITFGELGYGSVRDRLLPQSTALDPLLVAPGRGEVVLNGTYRTDQNPEHFLNATRRVGKLAVSLSAEGGQERLIRREASSLEVGLPLGEDDHLVGFVAARGASLDSGARRENPVGRLLYEKRLDSKTRLWAAGSYEGPLEEAGLPGLSRLKEESFRYEVRADRRLTPRQSLSLGASHVQGSYLAQGSGPEQSVERTLERGWIQHRYLAGKRAVITTGAGLDRLRGANDKVSPYLGVLLVPDDDTLLSLGVVRQSDIPLLVDPNANAGTQLLDAPLISATGLFPLRDDELEFMRVNSPDLVPFPYWDYRLQLRRAVRDDLFAVLEVHQTDVLPSDVGGQVAGPLIAIRPAEGRSRLRGAGLQAEFQRRRTFANLTYRYRDYRDDQGRRWLLVPRHELSGQLLYPLPHGLRPGAHPRLSERHSAPRRRDLGGESLSSGSHSAQPRFFEPGVSQSHLFRPRTGGR